MWSTLHQVTSQKQIISNHECGWLYDTEDGMQSDEDGMWHECPSSGSGAHGFLSKGYRMLSISSLLGNSCRQKTSGGKDAEKALGFWLAKGKWLGSHRRQTMHWMGNTVFFFGNKLWNNWMQLCFLLLITQFGSSRVTMFQYNCKF